MYNVLTFLENSSLNYPDKTAVKDNNSEITYKELVIKAKDTDSIVTGRGTGHPCRNVKTKFAKRLANWERDGGTPEGFEEITLGSLRKAVVDGNVDEGSFLCGAIAGMVNEIKPCKQIIDEMMAGAEKLLSK